MTFFWVNYCSKSFAFTACLLIVAVDVNVYLSVLKYVYVCHKCIAVNHHMVTIIIGSRHSCGNHTASLSSLWHVIMCKARLVLSLRAVDDSLSFECTVIWSRKQTHVLVHFCFASWLICFCCLKNVIHMFKLAYEKFSQCSQFYILFCLTTNAILLTGNDVISLFSFRIWARILSQL